MTYRIQYETQFKPTVAKGRKHDIIFTNKLNKAISISEHLFDRIITSLQPFVFGKLMSKVRLNDMCRRMLINAQQ